MPWLPCFFSASPISFSAIISEKSAGDPGASVKAAMRPLAGNAGCSAGRRPAVFKISGRGFSGLPGKEPLLLPLAAGVTLALGMFLLKTSLAANPLAKGPIVAVTLEQLPGRRPPGLGVLREKLSPGQWAGFLIIVAGIVAGQPGRRRPRQPCRRVCSPSWPCSFREHQFFSEAGRGAGLRLA